MRSSIPLFIGLRYVGARRRNQMVSFLSLISMAGLVVGVGLLITVLSVMNGFDRDLREKILGLVPQASIMHSGGINDWRRAVSLMEEDERVAAAAPFVQLDAMVGSRNEASAVLLYGIDPGAEKAVSLIEEYVPDDVLFSLNDESPRILLGQSIADGLKLKVGERVMVIVPNTQGRGRAAKLQHFEVAGIVKSNTELDGALAVTSLQHAGNLSRHPGAASGIRLKLTDLFQAPTIVYQNLLKMEREMPLQGSYYGNNWTRSHGNLYHAIKMSKNLVGLLMSLIVAIAAFNVVSTLVMVVVDKQGDIAILRTLGASTRKIMGIFVVQGAMIGSLGTLIGVVLGCVLSLFVKSLVSGVEALFNVQFLQSDVYPLTYLPTEILVSDIIQVAGTALVMSFLATLYPAWKASRVQPAEALRYE